jgi:hypothetical protein
MRVKPARAAAAIVGCGHGAGKEKKRKMIQDFAAAGRRRRGRRSGASQRFAKPGKGRLLGEFCGEKRRKGEKMFWIANPIAPVLQ